MTTITSDTGTYSAGGYTVANDPWGKGSLVNGVDYSQSVSYNPADFPNGVAFTWSWPEPTSSAYTGFYGYPHIELPSPTVGSSLVKAADVSNLAINYSVAISGQTSNFDVGFDLFFSNASGVVTNEVMVLLHTPANISWSNASYTVSSDSLQNAIVANMVQGGNAYWPAWKETVIQSPGDLLSGTIDVSQVISTLIWNGVLTGQEYLSSIQFGSEIEGGNGSLSINSLSEQSSTSNTITFAAGQNVLNVGVPKGSDIIGNGAADTAIYSGTYSQYQLKSQGSELLVRQSSDAAHLDVLQGVDFLQFSDGTYNVATGAFSASAHVAAALPTVTSVTPSGAGVVAGSGVLTAGATVILTVNLSDAVTVTGGAPTLTLNDGGAATYVGGSGSNALTFSYTVAAGQNASELAVSAFNLGGAVIKDYSGASADIAGAVGNVAGTLQVDATPATVSSVNVSGASLVNGSGAAGAGAVLTLTINLTEAVTVTGGVPTLALNDGGVATYVSGSGTDALKFTYTVAAGQNTSELAIKAINFTGSTLKDLAGNVANMKNVVGNVAGNVKIQMPTTAVTGVAVTGTGIVNNSGDLSAGHVVTITLSFSGPVTLTGGSPTLTLNDGGTATYLGGSGGSTLKFKYTVAAGQNTADLAVNSVNLGAAKVTDVSGNAAVLSGAIGAIAGTLKIDTTAPSAAKAVASGAALVGGSGALKVGDVATLTVSFSEAVWVNGGVPALTLNDGGVATYIGGSGGNVLQFAYTVAAGQTSSELAIKSISLGGSTVKDAAGNAASLTNVVGNVSGAVSVEGTSVSSGAKLQVASAIPSAETFSFQGSGGTLSLNDLYVSGAQLFHGSISGFGVGDTLDLGAPFGAGTTVSFAENAGGAFGLLSIHEGAAHATITLLGDYTTHNFLVESDGHGGSNLVYRA